MNTDSQRGTLPERRKSILIVCKGFFPGNSPRAHRATELAIEFARRGHAVTVLTLRSPEDHDRFERDRGVVIRDLGRLRWRQPYFGGSRLGRLVARACARFSSLALEYPDVELVPRVAQALRGERNHDLLISVAAPHPIHWGVARARRRRGEIARVWVADCGDPYMGCTTDSWRKPFYFAWIERGFMRRADYVTIPVESARQAYYAEFHKKIRVIPQGFRIPDAAGSIEPPRNPVPTFAYAGGFIPGVRDPRAFLDHLASLGGAFRFVVFTKPPDLVRPYGEALGDRLEVREHICRDELLKVLRTMDFLVNFDNNTDSAVPSKLIDYAIVGRPVLNIRKVLDPASIQGFLRGDYRKAMKLESVDQYRIERVCQQFLDLLGDR